MTDSPPLRCLFCQADTRRAHLAASEAECRRAYWKGVGVGLISGGAWVVIGWAVQRWL